jgi:hypothetical protein
MKQPTAFKGLKCRIVSTPSTGHQTIFFTFNKNNRHRWEDNIKPHLKVIEREDVEWIQPAQDRHNEGFFEGGNET